MLAGSSGVVHVSDRVEMALFESDYLNITYHC